MGWAGRTKENRREKRALALKQQYKQIIKIEDRNLSFKSGCIKSKYHSFPMAQHIKEKVWRERGVELRIYYCDNCNGYHVTKQIGEE